MLTIILEDLRRRFGDKIYLDTDDLAAISEASRGQNANLRCSGKYPIPTEKFGGRVVVSIYALAKHLAKSCEEEVRSTTNEVSADRADARIRSTKRSRRAEKKSQKGLLEGNWWLFHSPHLIAVLERSTLHVDKFTPSPKEGGFPKPLTGRTGGGI